MNEVLRSSNKDDISKRIKRLISENSNEICRNIFIDNKEELFRKTNKIIIELKIKIEHEELSKYLDNEIKLIIRINIVWMKKNMIIKINIKISIIKMNNEYKDGKY